MHSWGNDISSHMAAPGRTPKRKRRDEQNRDGPDEEKDETTGGNKDDAV